MLSLFLYNIFLSLYDGGLRIVSVYNRKAKARLTGTRTIFNELENWRVKSKGDKFVWMHCASLGEFEQGRPVIEKIRSAYPSYKILITFFSASGYEVRKNYSGAEGVFYLPADSRKHAEKFIEIVKPSLVIWVKYEYWYYYLNYLKRKNIPVLLVSAIFRESQPFFKFFGGLWRKMLRCFNKIFVQNAASLLLLKNISMDGSAVIAGDTRFDRVTDNAEKGHHIPENLVLFCKDKRVIVGGSTWDDDDEEIVHYMKIHKDVKLIIAPHETGAERLKGMKKLFTNSIFYSELQENSDTHQVLIIDNVGMLSTLYALADLAYIGGGFNESGIHNILEAAVFGKPVIFGPRYEKFQEANDLVKAGGAFSIQNTLELEAIFDKLLNDASLLHETGNICKNYVYEKRGATEKIMQYIQANRLLTN